jgi:hypothetical protein
MSSRCFLPQKECKFVIDIVDGIINLLKYNLPIYGGIVASLVYDSNAGQTTEATLDLDGVIAAAYYARYREPYPLNTVKTQLQISRINELWGLAGFPEKQITS